MQRKIICLVTAVLLIAVLFGLGGIRCNAASETETEMPAQTVQVIATGAKTIATGAKAMPQVHPGVYTMTASETEMRFVNGAKEICVQRTPYDYVGEAGQKGIHCIAAFNADGKLLWWEEIPARQQ